MMIVPCEKLISTESLHKSISRLISITNHYQKSFLKNIKSESSFIFVRLVSTSTIRKIGSNFVLNVLNNLRFYVCFKQLNIYKIKPYKR